MINKEVLCHILAGKDNRYQNMKDNSHYIWTYHDWQNLEHWPTCQILHMVPRICFKTGMDIYVGLVYLYGKVWTTVGI